MKWSDGQEPYRSSTADRARCDREDVLSPEFGDWLVPATHAWVKDLVGKAISQNNKVLAVTLEAFMSEVDDALGDIDRETSELASEFRALADQLKGQDKSIAAKIRERADKLDAVGKPEAPESDEPVKDGEPLPHSDPQTLPVEGGEPFPVSNFPEVENPSDGSSGLSAQEQDSSKNDSSADSSNESKADEGVDDSSK